MIEKQSMKYWYSSSGMGVSDALTPSMADNHNKLEPFHNCANSSLQRIVSDACLAE